MSYIFGKEDPKKYIVPFEKKSLKGINLSHSFIEELYDSHTALETLRSWLVTMILDVRKNKGKVLKLSEVDLKTLFDIANKKIQINYKGGAENE